MRDPTPPDSKFTRIIKLLEEVESLVLAFIGFMILWLFSAFGITIPFLWNVVIVIIIVLAAVLWWRYSKRRGR